LYTHPNAGAYLLNSGPMPMRNTSDYAANAGHKAVWWGGDPGMPRSWTDAVEGRGFVLAPTMDLSSGISHQRSEISFSRINDGAVNVYLVGEKYRCPDFYEAEGDNSDDHPITCADDYDIHSWAGIPGNSNTTPVPGVTWLAPLQDTPGLLERWRFGSAHTSVFNMAFCDGSLRSISYEISEIVHLSLANRDDGNAVTLGQ
jgi:hypothetical protein